MAYTETPTPSGKIGDAAAIEFDENRYYSEGYLYKDTRYYSREKDGTEQELIGVNRNRILADDKLVIKVEYRKQDHLAREEVWFFIHLYAEKQPTGWAQTTIEDYMPEGSNDTKTPWKGTATNIDDLKAIKDELKDTGKCNYFEEETTTQAGAQPYFAFYNWTAGIDALSNYTFNDGTKAKIDTAVAEYTNPNPEDISEARKGEYSFSEDDVLWYVYKRQNYNNNHIDGYVSTYITYNPGFDTEQQPYQGARVRFGREATVLKNQFTREGFVFAGWEDADGVKYDEGYTIDALDCKLQLYATWRRVGDLEGSYQVHYFYQKSNGQFNDGTNGTEYKPDEQSGVISVSFDAATNFAPVDVSVTPAENVKRYFVNYHFVSTYSENKLTGTVNPSENDLILKVYYFRDNQGKELTVKAKSAVKEYDGTELVNAEYDVFDENGNAVSDVTATISGSQTNVGKSSNLVTSITFGGKTYTVNRDAKGNPSVDQDDYDKVTIIDGDLEVTPIKLIVTVRDEQKTYGESDPARFVETVNRVVTDENGNKSYVSFDLAELQKIASYSMIRESGENVLPNEIVNYKTYYQINFENTALLNSNYEVEYVPGKFIINPRPVTLRSGDNLNHEFTGEPVTNETVTVVEGNFVGNENVYVKMDPEAYAIYPGDVKINLFDVTRPVEGTLLTNYVITKQYGTLSVKKLNGGEKIKLLISVDAGTDGGKRRVEYYDGTIKKVDVKLVVDGNVYTTTEADENKNNTVVNFKEAIQKFVDGLKDFFVIKAYAAEDMGREITSNITLKGVTFTVGGIYVYGGEGLDVEVYPVWLNTDDMSVTVNEINVTDQFEVELVDATVTNEHGQRQIGELEILPRPVTLTSESATKVYDGTALTRPNVTESGMGFVEGEVADIRATGTVTDPGTAVNTIEYQKMADYKDINYIVTLEEGNLEVTPVDNPDPDPDPNPDPDPDPDPSPDPDDPDTPDNPSTPSEPSTPPGEVLGAQRANGQVLGAQRSTDGAAVLGARRGGTYDPTDTIGRIITIIIAAGIGFAMVFIKRKKEEEN